MNFRNVIFFNLLLFLVVLLFQKAGWFMNLLTVAQLIFVPIVLYVLTKEGGGRIEKILPSITMLASVAVFLNQFVHSEIGTSILAFIYLVFTFVIALYGLKRSLNRGFVHFEEYLIDIGLIFLAMGGIWFFAYEVELNLGFSPIITWLTSIHFHYSAFLLPVFFGLLGRMLEISKSYLVAGTIIIISPWIVALGISFSVFIEVVSVVLYIIGIYISIVLSIKAQIKNKVQRSLIVLSFSTLGLSIIFSFLYAFGNYSGLYAIGIDDMIKTHGLLNTVFFALIGIVGWLLYIPQTKVKEHSFPVSSIRGSFVVDEEVLKGKTDSYYFNGLVDNMAVYQMMDSRKITSIVDFYENTNSYRLFARVKWSYWFLPFVWVYKLFSKRIKQLNLPLSSKLEEMTGDIISIDDSKDGRRGVRAWIRKIKGEAVFVALYSEHVTDGKTFMNIALPLPGASMIGILDIRQKDNTLCLTSKRESNDSSDPGIYLAFGDFVMKLPLEEQFEVWDIDKGVLEAKHKMWIFSLPFLKIEYDIKKKNEGV